MSNHNSCGLCSIEMKNISVTSGEDILLDNINLTFHCGELTALIGKNGAGKTTLLRTLLGERHYKGSISFTDHHGVVLPRAAVLSGLASRKKCRRISERFWRTWNVGIWRSADWGH